MLLIREALDLHGVTAELLVLTDGEKAIDFFEGLNRQGGVFPDLAIVDLSLPKRSGLEVLQHIRPGFEGRKPAIVVLSSSDTPGDKSESHRLGADLFIQKPSRLDEFMNIGAVLKAILLRQSGSL
uniref:Response regulator receiver protein n=1 Tax=Solibacter usitatus (strain Ellin6076) TaxID=234267 RepID=Q01UA8_SOLUE